MRFVGKVFLVLGILLVILTIGFVIFLKTFDIGQFKTRLTQGLEKVVGRHIVIDRLEFGFSFTHGIVLHLGGVRVDDDPRFSAKVFLDVGETELQIDWQALLLRQQVVVANVDIVNPELRLIRNEKGEINVQQIQLKNAAPAGKPDSRAVSDEKGPGPLLIHAFHIRNGTLVWIDRLKDPATEVTIENVRLDMEDFSLREAFTFDAQGSLWSAEHNVSVKGLGQFHAADSFQARFDDIQIQIGLAGFDMPRARKGFPPLNEWRVTEMGGQLDIFISQVVLGPEGLMLLAMEGKVENGRVKTSDMAVPFEDIQAEYEMSEQDLDLTSLTMRLQDGRLTGSGSIAYFWTNPRYACTLTAEHVLLQHLLPPFDAPVEVSGLLDSQFELSAKGIKREQVLSSISGSGSMTIAQGVINKMNVLRTIMGKISVIPDLLPEMLSQLPPQYREAFEKDQTRFDKFQFEFSADNGSFTVRQATLAAEDFTFLARGTLDWQQQVSLYSTVYISQGLSDRMVSSVDELAMLKEADGRIKIPLTPYEGALKSIGMWPDFEYLGKQLLRVKGRDEMQRLLDKAFKREGHAPDSDGEGETQPSPEQEILENLLERIFR